MKAIFPILFINLIYILWISYLSNLILGDKIYVVYVFWTIVCIAINLIGLIILKWKKNPFSYIVLVIILVEILSVLIVPFFL